MAEYVCEICGQAATIHMTLIDHGVKTDKHLCHAHASESGVHSFPGLVPGQNAAMDVLRPSAQQQIAQGVLRNLRGSVNFIKCYGRTPSSVEELQEGMAMKGDGMAVEIKDAELAKGLAWMEKIILFVEAHGRMPQMPDELTEFERDMQEDPRIERRPLAG